MQRFGSNGQALGEPITAASAITGLVGRPKVAVDAAGLAAVAWQRRADADSPDRMFALLLRVDGQPLGPPFPVNTFGYGTSDRIAIEAEGGGVFVVLWTNLLQGGRVARRVSVLGNPDASPTPSSPAAPMPESMPHFGAAQIVDSELHALNELAENRVLRSDTGAWLIAQADGRVRSTTDDGKYWGPSVALADDDKHPLVAFGGDGAGTWLALRAERGLPIPGYRRSNDGGVSWSDQRPLGKVTEWVPGCSSCRPEVAAVTGSPNGTWVAAWSYVGETRGDDGNMRPVESIGVVRATQAGTSW